MRATVATDVAEVPGEWVVPEAMVVVEVAEQEERFAWWRRWLRLPEW